MEEQNNLQIIAEQFELIKNNQVLNDYHKGKHLFELFNLILEEASSEEKISFTTLFSRLAFIGTKYKISPSNLHLAHVFRKAHETGIIRHETETDHVKLGVAICGILLRDIFMIATAGPSQEEWQYVKSRFDFEKRKTIGFRPVVEAVLFSVDPSKKELRFFDDQEPTTEKTALYDIHDKNEIFNQNIESLIKTFTLPIHVNFIDTEIREDGVYLPAGLIIHPDHLVDVTAIAECFKEFGSNPFLYLISRFKQSEPTTPLLTGNLVNTLLDELISDPDTNLASLLPVLFRSNPLGFSILGDDELRDLVDKLKMHFNNLQDTIKNKFTEMKIRRENIFLEPSFFSRDYGIQGRLDVLHQREDQKTFDIIELKSGSTFRTNTYGINAGHYIQTLLYELMIQSSFSKRSKSFNYILYSKEVEKPLRFAPPVKAQQFEAMKLRNELMAIEQKLKNADTDDAILRYLKPQNFPKFKGFNLKDVENFHNIYTTLDSVCRLYFRCFTAFVAREQSMTKTGEHGVSRSNGHAALWLESNEEKRDRFSILSGLSILENHTSNEDAFITFLRKPNDQNLVNFRIGDIGVLYPAKDDQSQAVLRNQIFKCTITGLDSEKVTVRLRNKQYNQRLFTENNSWNIEPDNLDSSFGQMYRSLFAWATAPEEYRDLYLGRKRPGIKKQVMEVSVSGENLTRDQQEMLEKMANCRDYFLLWGPPGTGKTSVVIKNLVRHLHDNTAENVLLLAYTNRAVDEICDALTSLGVEFHDSYLRIGSRFAADGRFHDRLLEQFIRNARTRAEIVALLTSKRIFVSTVSSILGRPELFSLKEFDTVIIDEASQILEPMLAGLLSRFKRYILVGDHKQLPAVVTQSIADANIMDEGLRSLGFTNTCTSLFERLYLHVRKQGWDHAYGILGYQGRMHTALMEFPNNYFYEGKLKVLDSSARQTASDLYKHSHPSYSWLAQRKIFIDTPEDNEINWKTNKFEAEKCLEIIRGLLVVFDQNKIPLTPESIGIITPYRAQIALIRQKLEVLPPEVYNKISVDTVERYQGGARSVIIISFCVNRLTQLDSLVSLSNEGTDRKMNVAITRAKEQIILIGNKNLLSKNETYRKLIEHYELAP